MAVNFAKPPELKALQTATEWTLQAQPGAAIGPFHWKNRRLTFQEMCRLQTFPDGQSAITLDLALKWDAGPRDGATAFRGA
jgi:site-specific DNA-cytosine methylase